MAFVINTFKSTAGDRTGTAYEITNTAGTVRAEIWPQWGFNCLRWQKRQPDGSWGDILYTAPDWAENPIPTRSGHPILFPFPGRLRDGRFTFGNATVQLPLTDSSRKHAIHGFTPRNPWRATDDNGDSDFGFVTGEFRLRDDLPGAMSHWPADFLLKVTYRLHANFLRVTATVENRGNGPLPFGLGYHPYFRLPDVTDPDVGRYVLQANMEQYWEADSENLLTGWRHDLSGDEDFRLPHAIGSTHLDKILTVVTARPEGLGDLLELAVLSHPDSSVRLRVMADPSFRELVLFTPPHRQAVAIEPYTCSADAAILDARGVQSGWRTLEQGEEWESIVEYHLESN